METEHSGSRHRKTGIAPEGRVATSFLEVLDEVGDWHREVGLEANMEDFHSQSIVEFHRAPSEYW